MSELVFPLSLIPIQSDWHPFSVKTTHPPHQSLCSLIGVHLVSELVFSLSLIPFHSDRHRSSVKTTKPPLFNPSAILLPATHSKYYSSPFFYSLFPFLQAPEFKLCVAVQIMRLSLKVFAKEFFLWLLNVFLDCERRKTC